MPKAILSPINLNAYSKTPGFIGYFEAKHSSQGKKEAIALMDAYFVQHPPTHLATALVQFEHKAAYASSDAKAALELLMKQGLVAHGSYIPSAFSTQFFDTYDNKTHALLWQAIFDGLLLGHCFYCWDALKLAVYPHDDIGFGAIALDSDAKGTHAGTEVLRQAAHHSLFTLHLCPPARVAHG